METTSLDALRRTESLNKQVGDLSNLVKSKDAASAVVRERNTMQETEVEKMKVRLEHAQKDRDSWKNKALSNSSEEEEMLRVSDESRNMMMNLVTNWVLDFCFMHDLPQQFQEYSLEDVRSLVLQSMR
jgi:hypothetical protein